VVVVGDDPKAASLVIFVFVLPVGGPVRGDDEIEHEIERVVSHRCPAVGAFEVDVPRPP
jgi:hypothetical protein